MTTLAQHRERIRRLEQAAIPHGSPMTAEDVERRLVDAREELKEAQEKI